MYKDFCESISVSWPDKEAILSPHKAGSQLQGLVALRNCFPQWQWSFAKNEKGKPNKCTKKRPYIQKEAGPELFFLFPQASSKKAVESTHRV